jgi:hypothetical protein
MIRPGAIALPLALAATLAAGCGEDKAERARFARAQAACATAVGMTVNEASAALQLEPPVVAQACLAAASPVGVGDSCPGAPGTYTAPVCEVGVEWCALGTSLCGSGPLGGCAYACILRVAAADRSEVLPASTVCASTFVSGQPFGPISFQPCR